MAKELDAAAEAASIHKREIDARLAGARDVAGEAAALFGNQ